MNKFIIVKCKSQDVFQDALNRIKNKSLNSLSFIPNRIRVDLYEEELTVVVNFELSDSGGFDKNYYFKTPQETFMFDGFPIHESINYSKNIAKQFSNFFSNDNNAIENLFGTWAFAKFSSLNGGKVLSDFTGMTPVFYKQNSQMLLISTRQTLIAEISNDITKNLTAMGWLGAQSNLFENQMPYSEVLHLAPQHTLSFSNKPGDLSFSIKERELWCKKHKKHDTGIDYNVAVNSLINQSNAIANLPLNHFNMDITGGLDSRLVLAIALNSNMKNKIEYLKTSGIQGGHEIEVGKSIANLVGIEHQANITNPNAANKKITPEVILNQIKRSNFRYEGSLCLSDARVGPSNKSTLVQTGSAGEIYRRHCKPHMKIDITDHQMLLETYNDYHQMTDPLNIMHSHLKLYYQQSLQKLATELADAQADMNDISDIFFMKYRLPLWNGIMANNIYTAVKIYPLVNYQVSKLAFNKSYKSRINDEIHFELMMRLDKRLLSAPFLKYKWPDYLQKKADVAGINVAKEAFKTHGANSLANRNSAIGVIAEQGIDLFRSYLLDDPHSDIWNIFSKNKIEKALDQTNTFSLVQIKELFAVTGIKSYYHNDFARIKDNNNSTPKLDGYWAQKLFG